MRIVHLSDIHLSKENYKEFINDYREALIKDLQSYNNPKIDVIVITGDLVDKGGHSLYQIDGFVDKVKYPNPFYIFEEVFIDPIVNALNFKKDNFLFIPGNHDINEDLIMLKEEYRLTKDLNNENINTYLQENTIFKHSERIKQFKDFEYNFHVERSNVNYKFTENQSTYIYDFNNIKLGFLLVNDSWRCKSPYLKFIDETDKMYFGIQQLHDGLNELNNTQINIVLFHHQPSYFTEEEEINGFLGRKNIDLVLYGHNHSIKTVEYIYPNGKCYYLRGKTSYLKPQETHRDYMPGYQIIDIDVNVKKIIKIDHRLYNNKPEYKNFVFDSFIGKNGIDRNKTNEDKGYIFFREEKSNYNLSKEDHKL